MIWQSVVAFGSMVVLDFVWARYNIACAERKVWLAGLYSSVILGLGAFVVLTYVENHYMLIPAMTGAFVGTVIAVKWK